MMRINIAVHGRFYDFHLAAALLRQGHDVQLLTNYPPHSAAQWFSADRTRGFVLHGLMSRAAGRIAGGEPPQLIEAGLKHMFGTWAARHNAADMPDLVHCWSGIAEESLRACRKQTICTVARGSAHIREQFALLAEEEARVGRKLEKPSSWIIAREEREYALARRVIVASEFARDSFVKQGHPATQVSAVPLVHSEPAFAASAPEIEARVKRLRAGAPLRVLYAGLISYRKGMHDMLTVMQALGARMEFRMVGTVLPECRDLVKQAARHAAVEAAVPERQLKDVYAWGDVFVLPTIEDGFAVVLTQAQAAGLPILTTTNCGGPDIIANGGQGWTTPIRSPHAIVEQLEWCNDNREAMASMVERLHATPAPRTWDDVARDFIKAATE
jgi:glycosyltransferase involved in cell wall biosynthesis